MSLLLRLGIVVALLVVLVAGAIEVGAQFPTRQVAYEARVGFNSDIFLLDIDRGLVRNITRSPGLDGRPRWSPDGTRIAFESWRGSIRGIYVMEADGTHVLRLSANLGASEYNPQWTPDGQAVLFQSYWRALSSESTVLQYRVDADGSHLQRVELDPRFGSPPSDRYISGRFADGAWGLYVVEQNVPRWLTNSPVLFAEAPVWSPDDRLIAFVSADSTGGTEVYIMNADGTQLRQITDDGLLKGSLRWRP